MGAVWKISSEAIRVAPDPDGFQKLCLQIEEVLARGVFEPEVASRSAGKLAFVNRNAFGRTGTAAPRPLHARAKGTSACRASLNVGLEGALCALFVILERLTPRFVPFVLRSLRT